MTRASLLLTRHESLKRCHRNDNAPPVPNGLKAALVDVLPHPMRGCAQDGRGLFGGEQLRDNSGLNCVFHFGAPSVAPKKAFQVGFEVDNGTRSPYYALCTIIHKGTWWSQFTDVRVRPLRVRSVGVKSWRIALRSVLLDAVQTRSRINANLGVSIGAFAPIYECANINVCARSCATHRQPQYSRSCQNSYQTRVRQPCFVFVP
jgi:hypothetical protein